MTVIRNNSISGINSITAQSGALNFYDSTGNTLSIGASVSGNITGDVTGNLTGNVTVATGATISGSTNTIIASTNGSERVRINSSGNVGIGTDNPTFLLQVQNDTESLARFRRENTGSSHGGIIVGNQSRAIKITGGDDGLIITDNTLSQERLRITSGGDVQIANGNLVFSTSGTGIDFSATSNGSGTTNSELLDDYEEGTWTPSVGGTATYAIQTGEYIKTGRAVYITGQLRIISIGTGNANNISGLPFVAISGNNEGGGVIHYWASLSASTIQPVIGVGPGGSSFDIYSRNAANTTAGVNGGLLGDSARVFFSAFYFVA